MLIRLKIFTLVVLSGSLAISGVSDGQTPDDKTRIELLQKETEQNPENVKLALLLGGMLRQEGSTREANSVVENSIAVLKQRMASEGETSELLYSVGLCSLFLERNEVAFQNFQLALAMEPEREEIHLGLVRSLLNQGKREQAVYALELAQTLFPESEIVKQQLVEAYESEGDYGEAIPILEELRRLNPKNPAVFERLLTAYVKTGDAEKAAPLFDELAERGGISPLEAIINVYRIYLANDDLRSARIELQKAASLDKNHPIVADAFREYYSLQAKAAEADGNYRRAILFWERAVESFPDDWNAQYSLAIAHAELQNHEDALELFVSLAERQPADPFFYAYFARTLVALKNFEAAKKVVDLGVNLASEKKNRLALAELETVRNEMARAMGFPEWPTP